MIKTMEESEDGFPKLAFVQGRISDMVYLPDGSCVDGSFLTTICDNYSEYISCYQVYQGNDFQVTFRVVPKNNDQGTIDVINTVANALRVLVKEQIEIKIDITNVIEDFAGKRKFIISEIALAKLK